MSDLVLGIDLGTSNTVVSVVQEDRILVATDGENRRIHPSMVSFHPSGAILVGHKAKARRVIDPANTIYSSKRMIGRRFSSGEVQSTKERVPFVIEEGPNQQPLIATRDERYAIPEISSLVLAYAKRIAEAFLGQRVDKAVITVPANFNDAQREATRTAGTLAGLEVLRILNEPTAAALAYGYGKGLENVIAIYDFGGGTFDVTILALSDRVYEVLSTAGNTFLGGDDIDHRIVELMAETFLSAHAIDLRTDPLAMERLKTVAEQVKIQLSTRAKAVVQVQKIAVGLDGRSLDLVFSLKREELHARIADIVDESLVVCADALRLAGRTASQIDDVVLVGGTTRMPLVRERVAQFFGRRPREEINPDEVVAIGAGIHGATLLQSADADRMSTLLLDITPRALGLATVGGFADTVIARNAQLPLEQTRIFTTTADDQAHVKIQICQGESRRFDENTALGELTLDGLRPAPRGRARVAVTFELDCDGILQVSAADPETGRSQSARIQLLGALSEEELTQAIGRHRDRRIDFE